VTGGASEDLDRFLKESGRYGPSYYTLPFDGFFSPILAKSKSEKLSEEEFI